MGDITQPIEKIHPSQTFANEFTYLDISSIDNSAQRIVAPKIYESKDSPSRARQLVRANDVLFSTVRTYLKNIAQVPAAYDGQIASTGFSVLRAQDNVDPTYLFYYCLTEQFLSPLNDLQRGTSYPAVRDSDVREQPIPLAPLPEQHRIVAKIEELFTRLDVGVATLKRMWTALKRYKAAVLKAACEGRLVPQDPNDEPASKLLERILAERRAKWEEGLRVKDKDPKKVKYEEPEAPDEDGLTQSPRGWVWATIDQIISMLQYGTSVKADSDETLGVAVLRMGNLQEGRIQYSNLKYISRDKEDASKYQLVDGDVLINRTNSAELVGKAGLFARDGQFIFASYLIRLRARSEAVIPNYLVACINSEIGRRHINKVKHQVAGQANINSQNIREMPIPLPPIREQERITEEIDRRLSVVQELEATVAANLVRAERLRQSILKRAFEGKLVAQDAGDEAAGVLLERIRVNRLAANH